MLLSTRSFCWVKPALQCYTETNCVEMKTLKISWHDLERKGNIWNPKLLWLCTSSEKMDCFTDVPDRLINPVALPVWYISRSTKWKWEREVKLYYMQWLFFYFLSPLYIILFKILFSLTVYCFPLTGCHQQLETVIDSTSKNIRVLRKPLVLTWTAHCFSLSLCIQRATFLYTAWLNCFWSLHIATEVRGSKVLRCYGSSWPKFEFH